jgi:hypothetical protein
MMSSAEPIVGFDEATARREGWVIADCGDDNSGLRPTELQQRLDNPEAGEGTFPDDVDAWKARRREGAAGLAPAPARPSSWSTRSSGALIEQHAGRW